MKEKIRKLEAEKEARRAAKRTAKTKSNETTTRRDKEDKSYSKKRHEKKENSPEAISYYSNFTKKPVDFRAMYASSSEDEDVPSSSSSDSGSSSDDFPSPGTPHRRRQSYKRDEDYGDLFKKVRDMQRRMYEMEIQNRKLRTQKK